MFFNILLLPAGKHQVFDSQIYHIVSINCLALIRSDPFCEQSSIQDAAFSLVKRVDCDNFHVLRDNKVFLSNMERQIPAASPENPAPIIIASYFVKRLKGEWIKSQGEILQPIGLQNDIPEAFELSSIFIRQGNFEHTQTAS